jgi:hypothetical protein
VKNGSNNDIAGHNQQAVRGCRYERTEICLFCVVKIKVAFLATKISFIQA